MQALADLVDALAAAGGDRAILADPRTAHVVVSGQDLLSQRTVSGLDMWAERTTEGIAARLTVQKHQRIQNPIHLCFGVIPPSGTQRIEMKVTLEEGATAAFVAHCLFPRARNVRHLMDAVIDVGPAAEMRYSEAHYHGPFGGVEVVPKAAVKVAERGRYVSDFALTTGRVGLLAIDYVVETAARAVAEMTARVFGHGTDVIRIAERLVLAGVGSRGLIKTRVALEDAASAEVVNATEGRAEAARGHMDCMEIVKDNATASAVPLVKVTHPLAKVTHEAAIGTVDRKQLETLMAHGLTPEQAVETIVRGLLR